MADCALQREQILHHKYADLFYEHLFGCFRPPEAVLMDLLYRLKPALLSHIQPANPIPPHVKVLFTLGSLATGTFEQGLRDRADISELLISCTLLQVLDVINQLAAQNIHKFPYTDEVQVNKGIDSIAGLPNTIGAMNRLHINAPFVRSIPIPRPQEYLFISFATAGAIN